MSKNTDGCHVLVLTDDNCLVYEVFDEPVTHLEVYKMFKEKGVEVKDCHIQESVGDEIATILVRSICRWVSDNLKEHLDGNSLEINRHSKSNSVVITGIKGRTVEGTDFFVRPSTILNPEKNFFSEFC